MMDTGLSSVGMENPRVAFAKFGVGACLPPAEAETTYPAQKRNGVLTDQEKEQFIALHKLKNMLNDQDGEVMHESSMCVTVSASLKQAGIVPSAFNNADFVGKLEQLDTSYRGYDQACALTIGEGKKFFERLANDGRLFGFQKFVKEEYPAGQDSFVTFFVNNTTGDQSFAHNILRACKYFDGDLKLIVDGKLLEYAFNPFAGNTKLMLGDIAEILEGKKEELKGLLIDPQFCQNFNRALDSIGPFSYLSRRLVETLASVARYCDLPLPLNLRTAEKFVQLSDEEQRKLHPSSLCHDNWSQIERAFLIEDSKIRVSLILTDMSRPDTALEAAGRLVQDRGWHLRDFSEFMVKAFSQSFSALTQRDSAMALKILESILNDPKSPVVSALFKTRSTLESY